MVYNPIKSKIWREKNKTHISKKRKSYYPQRKQYNKGWRERNPDKVKATQRKVDLKMKYGLTLEQYNFLMVTQNFKCAICNIDITDVTPHVDHCHKTNVVRGLLCNHCNLGIGHLRDNTEILQNAINYIRKFRQ